jgi:hypothetical protein
MSGAFGLCGIPENSIKEIRRLDIRGFYTPAGHATLVADGKEEHAFDVPCILECHCPLGCCNRGNLPTDLAIMSFPAGAQFDAHYYNGFRP